MHLNIMRYIHRNQVSNPDGRHLGHFLVLLARRGQKPRGYRQSGRVLYLLHLSLLREA